jgi:hypothetical protein
MVTWVIPARHGAGWEFSHAMVAALVRPSTWASRPPVPARSQDRPGLGEPTPAADRPRALAP